ncbi:glycolate oxidase subunit GlcF [Comamonas sp. NLF-1-9]|uniref:glycolate oxidase subunit GlcF n=1 Tax=Comamonas sp. NLF-1-9 TaxID=2853163 RepID=UPI001C43969B|nr:glycolate oxidase subunit GlcF [Comamonas sp. NLF-1-9]QXL83786.1 glycolate oxidase subunit GlcF [Comamonas sp. NLF-1-9]
MQTHLSAEFAGTPEGEEAEAILRKCVHCGFCLATCPTYQLMGDELDSPRGRIYLMKQVLEGQEPTDKTQLHLDRCLTCRNCETTCPSGVEYGKLLDIGRRVVEEKVARKPADKALRWALAQGLPSPLFAPAMKLGQAVRGLLPERLREKVPPRSSAGAWPTAVHARKVLLLAGCVQPSMAPGINGATARVLDAAGIQTLVAPRAGCCGAVKFHLNDQAGGKDEMRANIDAWWPYLERGEVECIVMNASGCGVTVKEYGHLLRHDPEYAARAAKVSAATRDISELLPELAALLKGKLRAGERPYAWHPPCTLQHGQKLRGGVEAGLRALGFELRLAASEAHLCCGSAGTYSVLQPETAHQLRDRKLAQLAQSFADQPPQAILSANIGCITHLQNGTDIPVRHWIEVLDEALAP